MMITLKDDNCELRLSDEMTEAGFINVIILGLSVGDVVNGTFSVDELRRAISSFEDQRTLQCGNNTVGSTIKGLICSACGAYHSGNHSCSHG